MWLVIVVDSFGCAYEWEAHVPTIEQAYGSIDLYLGSMDLAYARVVAM